MKNSLKFPKNWTEIKATFSSKIPILTIRGAPAGKPAATGKQLIHKYGMTPEERLAAIAPPKGSLPERMLYGWLVRHNVSFAWQTPIAGGRIPGGQILDFVLYEKAVPIVIRIMSYWHEGAANQLGDDIQLDVLLRMGFIVEDIFEYEINTIAKLDNRMRQVMYGTPKFREVA